MRDNWGTSTARGYWILTLGRGLWQPHPKATSRSRLFLGFPKIRPAQLHLLDTQSCAYKFPVCIQGSFAGKALLEKLLTSHKEGTQGHHLHIMELLGLWNFWHCTKNSGPWMMPRVGPGLNLKLLGQKRETIKDQNFIYKHEVRTASVTSYHCPSFPLFQSLLAFAYRHFRMKLLQRKMNFYCQEDAAKWNITLCAFMFIHHCVERPLQSLKVKLVPFNIWKILIYLKTWVSTRAGIINDVLL